MASFEPAVKYTLRFEGGYSKLKADPGGETNFGISKRSYPKLDIKNLTKAEARDIYRRDFWVKGEFDKLTSQAVATKAFDFSVNMGLRVGIRLLQKAVKALGRPVKVDGRVGPKTINAVNATYPPDLLKELKVQAAVRYARIAVKTPDSAVFLLGWMRRALS